MSELEVFKAIQCNIDQSFMTLDDCRKCPYHRDLVCSYTSPVSVVMLAERSKLVEPRSRW